MDRDDHRRAGPDTDSSEAAGSNTSTGNPTLEQRIRRLNARLSARGLPTVDGSRAATAITPPPTGRARERLSVFVKSQVEEIQGSLGQIPLDAWPRLDGCLGVLFTSRTGSRYLARELAARYRIGRMEESFNPHLVRGIAPADIVRSYADGWFSFKLGAPGIVSAELCGVISEYIEKTFLIFLLRRDIVGQAVSLVKANQTGQWHSIQEARRSPQYEGPEIARSVRVIADAVASLRDYLRQAERPWRTLFYEDFEHGDFNAAEAICDDFAVPRRRVEEEPKFAPLERTANAVNQTWIERFQNEMDDRTRDIVDKYVAAL
jgi:LPS sulfotransferase NodH